MRTLFYFLILFIHPEFINACISNNDLTGSFSPLNLKDSIFVSLKDAVSNANDVYRLDLRNQGIHDFPIDILKLKNLEYLNLGNNNLTLLPAEIKYLSNLKTLHLYGNSLKSLPNQINELSLLRELDISNNKDLISLPNEIWELKLEILDYDNENIDYLPIEFIQSSTLDFSLSNYGPFRIGCLSEGRRIFCKDDKMGVIESSGKMVMTPYQCPGSYSGGQNLPSYHYGKCFYYKDFGGYGLQIGIMDDAYKVIQTPTYYYLGTYCNDYFDFKNGLYPVSILKRNNKSYKWGFINHDGNIVFECNYSFGACYAGCEFMPEFSEDLCLFENSSGKFGYLDTNGQIKIPAIYYGASNFSEGLACVIQSKDPNNFYITFINKQGQKAFERTFDIEPFDLPFGKKGNEGYELTTYTLQSEILCEIRLNSSFKDGKCKIFFWDKDVQKNVSALINTNGEIIEFINE